MSKKAKCYDFCLTLQATPGLHKLDNSMIIFSHGLSQYKVLLESFKPASNSMHSNRIKKKTMLVWDPGVLQYM